MPSEQHDIITGSTLEGRAYADSTRDYTCNNWTSNVHVNAPWGRLPDLQPVGTPSARVGHSDKDAFVPLMLFTAPFARAVWPNVT